MRLRRRWDEVREELEKGVGRQSEEAMSRSQAEKPDRLITCSVTFLLMT